MIQIALIQNAHDDLVTDACYDMYGLYLATCGLDQRIKVWSLDESSGSGNWNLQEDWKAHDAAVTKVSWAHPSFGSIIASSSFDRSVKIWEQTLIFDGEPGYANGPATNGNSPRSRWNLRAELTEAKSSVRAVEFAPYHFGLKLAAISADNHLRIYECLESPSLDYWALSDEVDVPGLTTAPSRLISSLAHSLATSTPTPTASQSHASSGGIDGASVASLLQTTQREQMQHAASQGAGRPGLGVREADGGWCVSWCKDRYWGEVVAVGAGVSGVVKLVQFSPHRRPVTLLALAPERNASSAAHPPATPTRATRSGSAPYASAVAAGAGGAADDIAFAVTSVSWAPSCGRSFHLIATGSRDGMVRIWKVKPPPPQPSRGMASGELGADDQDMLVDGGEEKWSATLVAEFPDHQHTVTRVEWNITGTVLSSAGNDGRVRLWKQTVGGVWRTAGYISVEQTEEQEQPPSADVDMDEHALAD